MTEEELFELLQQEIMQQAAELDTKSFTSSRQRMGRPRYIDMNHEGAHKPVDAWLLYWPVRLSVALLLSNVSHAEEPLPSHLGEDGWVLPLLHSSNWHSQPQWIHPPTRSAQLPYVCLPIVALVTPSMSTSKWENLHLRVSQIFLYRCYRMFWARVHVSSHCWWP